VWTWLGNYSISYVDGQLMVDQKGLSITAGNRANTYVMAFTFAGTEFSVHAGDLVNGDTVSSVTLTSAGAAATATVAGSPYAIVASAAAGTGLGNYSITYHDGSYTDDKNAIFITVKDCCTTYGQTNTFAG